MYLLPCIRHCYSVLHQLFFLNSPFLFFSGQVWHFRKCKTDNSNGCKAYSWAPLSFSLQLSPAITWLECHQPQDGILMGSLVLLGWKHLPKNNIRSPNTFAFVAGWTVKQSLVQESLEESGLNLCFYRGQFPGTDTFEPVVWQESVVKEEAINSPSKFVCLIRNQMCKDSPIYKSWSFWEHESTALS